MTSLIPRAIASAATLTLVAIGLPALGSGQIANAASPNSSLRATIKVGAKCPKAGKTKKVGSRTFICTKVTVKKKKKLVWKLKTSGTGAPGTGGSESGATGSGVTWSWTGSTWRSSGGTPPTCPSTPYTLPTSLGPVRDILYPGQERNGDYKSHGGFGFSDSTSPGSVTVVAPVAGKIVQAASYLEDWQGVAQKQYLIEIVNPCGLMFRFDHLRGLASGIRSAVDGQLPGLSGSSATTQLKPAVSISAGEALGEGAGFTGDEDNNVFFDFGQYNLRKPNGVSPATEELNGYATCWFSSFDNANAATIRGLPARDGIAGGETDLC